MTLFKVVIKGIIRVLKLFRLVFLLVFPAFVAAQNVGIGTTTPLAKLHVTDSAVVFSAPGSVPLLSGNTPIVGAGRRMMWHPGKAAFRAGYVYGAAWDDINIGPFSFAAGQEVWASGNSSIALGRSCYSQGYSSIAIGENCQAGYNYDVAIGRDAASLAGGGVAIGALAVVKNTFGVAIGTQVTVSADNAFAIGNVSTASGTNSFAIGNYVNTSGYTGAFALGDASTTTVMQSFVANGFRARFAGGYRLFTNSAVTIGAFLNAGANSWAALSDKRMKENFLPVDGESFLKHIAAMPLTTWNYKGQDIKTMRHYGPMAQDFYAAFGKDALGEIGCDTLINQQDFLGVNLIAIQALGKRTEKINELEKKMDNLEKENAWLKEQLNTVLKAIKKAE